MFWFYQIFSFTLYLFVKIDLMEMKKGKIPRQVIFLGVISFFTDFASEMLYPIVPLFLVSFLGASASVVGLLEGLAEVIAGLLKGFFGAVSDKLGKRSLFVKIGYSLSAVVKPLPGFFPHVGVVFLSRLTDRVGKGIRTAPRDALLSYNSNESNSGKIFGFHRSMDTYGAVIGPLLAVGILSLFPGKFTFVFIAATVPSLFAIYFTTIVKDPPDLKTFGKTERYSFGNFWRSAPKKYKSILILLTFFSFANSSDVFLILKSNTNTGSNILAVLAYVVYNIVYAVSSYPAGAVADKIGKKKVYIAGLLIFSIVYFGFALNNSGWIVWPLFAIYGFYTAFTEGTLKAWISDIVRDEYMGTAIGLFTMVSGLAMLFGSVFTGVLWDAYGAKVPFLFSAVVSLIVAAALGTKISAEK